jgi:hypothetical protein
MAKKPTKSKLVKKLDAVFSLFVRMSNADHKGFCECITCGRKYHYKEIQAGHFMSRKHYSTRWDEDNVKPQCKGCNIFGQGEQYRYSVYLGKETSDRLLERSREIQKFTIGDIEEMILKYQEKLNCI